jgi:peptidyl-prolyl cis-trans isomerase SurA
MRKTILLFITLVCCSGLFAKTKDPVLITINGNKITKSEFEYIYNKNNSTNSYDKKNLDEYLNLYINFKLKVIEAQAKGLDTTKNFINELNGYRKQLAAPYLTDTKVEKQLIEEAYGRLKEEVDVSHILVRLPENPTPADTLAAYKKITAIAKRLQKEDFATVAKETSEDPSVKQNGGYIGFITGFWAVYPFETAAFSTPVGKISQPVRSQFGYHIVKVNARRPARGQILVAHIMKAVSDTLPETEQKAKEKIYELYNRIKAGEDFGKLAKENSDDGSSAVRNGELPWFGIGRMVKEFEDAAFGLTEKNQLSEPIKTMYGWHILKLLDKKEIEPIEDKKEEIKRRIMYDERAKKAENSFAEKLKKEYKFKLNRAALKQLQDLVEKTAGKDSAFYATGIGLNKSLFTFSNRIITQSEFVNFMQTNKTKSTAIEQSLNEFIKNELLSYEDSQLEFKYSDFYHLMQEYRDGILLFDISNTEVWDKATKDDVGLEDYFNQNNANYAWDTPRFKGMILHCINTTVADKAKKILKTAPKDSIDFLLRKLNNDSICIKIEKGLFAKGTNAIIDSQVFNIGSFSGDKNFPIVFTEGKLLEKGPESYLDIRGIITSDYQNFLEEEWIRTLRNKYKVIIDQDVLKTIKQN